MPNVVYNQLSARRIRQLTDPGRYTDGLGLMLLVDLAGNRRWVLRVSANGKRRDLGLGSAVEVSLKEAREKRDAIRSQIRAGVDPLVFRKKKQTLPTFEEFSITLHTELRGQWKNAKHRDQWINTLRTYAFPKLGKIPIDMIDALAIKRTLQPIWIEKPETARRVKQRIGRVMSAAIGDGLRPGSNPATDATAGLSAARPKVKHFAAMPYPQVPDFMERLTRSKMSPSARLAFQFLILTATRTNEVLSASWEEIDDNGELWTIPAGRMKMGERHQVPLSTRVAGIITMARHFSNGSDLLFPGQADGKPLSNMVFTNALKRFQEPYTAHGFRSSFRDWAEERTTFPHVVKEAALAHGNRNKVEAAYRRTTLLEKRRALMSEWADFATDGTEWQEIADGFKKP